MNTIKTQKLSMRDLFNVFDAFPSTGKVSLGSLYDEVEWNLIDLPKRNREKLPVGFFRGKTIVPIYTQNLSVYPPAPLKTYIDTVNGINYKVTFSSYENFFLHPPHLLFDFDTKTYSRTLRNVYDLTGRYIGGGRSAFDSGSILNGEWLQLDIGVYVTALKIAITPREDKLGEAPETLSIIGLTSMASWIFLGKMVYTTAYESGVSVVCHVNPSMIPCCSYRLVCEATSRLSGSECTSFSLSDIKIFGVTNRDPIPIVEIIWHNGSRHRVAINDNVRDFDALALGLCKEPVNEIKFENDNTVCYLYKGVGYSGMPLLVDRSIPVTSLNNVFSSIKVFSKTEPSKSIPFDIEGLVMCIMFGEKRIKPHDDSISRFAISGNLSTLYDHLRGFCLQFTFGSINLECSLTTKTIKIESCFTFMFWLKRDNNITSDKIKIIQGDMFMFTLFENCLEFMFLNSDVKAVDTKQTLSSDWTHYAIAYDGNVLKMYRNGVLHTWATTSLVLPLSWTRIELGKNWSNNGVVLLDNVRLFSKALSPVNLKHLFDFECFNPHW